MLNLDDFTGSDEEKFAQALAAAKVQDPPPMIALPSRHLDMPAVQWGPETFRVLAEAGQRLLDAIAALPEEDE